MTCLGVSYDCSEEAAREQFLEDPAGHRLGGPGGAAISANRQKMKYGCGSKLKKGYAGFSLWFHFAEGCIWVFFEPLPYEHYYFERVPPERFDSI